MELAGAAAGALVQGLFLDDAQDTQTKAIRESTKLQKEQLEFQKQRYERWKQIYGPLQEDLVSYVKNLTGSTLSEAEITKIQQATQQAQKSLHEKLAQRGLQNSGLELSLDTKLGYQGDIAEAQARAKGEMQAFNLKNSVLNQGLMQESTINSSMMNAASNASNAIYTGGNQMATTKSQIGNFWGQTVTGLSELIPTKKTDPDVL